MKDNLSEEQKMIARYAKAMGHPIRMFVLELLSKQACCYSGDLSDDLPVAKSTLSQHLKELKDAGLIQGETEAPRVKYCIIRKIGKKLKGFLNCFGICKKFINNVRCFTNDE